MKLIMPYIKNKDINSIYNIMNFFIDKIKNIKENNLETKNNDLFTLWISENQSLPELQNISLKSMLLTGHKVTLYTYEALENVPVGVKNKDANQILDKSNIFTYKEGFNKGSYSGFANWFRTKCLYQKGKGWFDCDILAIRNINEVNKNRRIISSQYNPDGSLNPNNAFLRLDRGDKLLKELLDYMENIIDNVLHGQTGPFLLKSMMDEQYKEYYKFLADPSFIAAINFFDYEQFLLPSQDVVPKLDIENIWGFHVWYAMFREYGNEHEKIDGGFYYDLKEAILTSSKKDEYEEKLNSIFNI